MVTLLRMTRFVDEERTNAGIFKAIGLSYQDIILKFLSSMDSFAGTIGTLRTLLGHYLLSGIISNIITQVGW